MIAGLLWLGGADLHTDDFAGNDEFHAAILLASLGNVIAGDRHRLPKAFRRYRVAGQSLPDKVFANGRRPLFGEPLVELIATSAVGVSLHFEIQSRVG